MFIPDIIRCIAFLLPSPLDLFSFSLVNKEIRAAIKASYSQQSKRTLQQGLIATNLREMNSLNKVLFGESRTGKSHLIMYYMLDYWRREGKSILVVLRGDKMRGWIHRAKAIFGNELPISIWNWNTYNRDEYGRFLKEESIPIGLNEGVCIMEGEYPGEYHHAEAIFHYNSLYSLIENIPSHYGLTIVDEESDVHKAHLDRETIFVRRPSLHLTTRNKRIRKAPKITLCHNVRVLPKPIYHSKIISLPYVTHSYVGPENEILSLLKKYKKVLVIMHPYYETPYCNHRLLKVSIESHMMYWRSHIKKIEKFNRSEKPSVLYGFDLGFANMNIHADCIVWYDIGVDVFPEIASSERSVLCESNPYKEVNIYYIKERQSWKPNEPLHPYQIQMKLMMASRFLQYSLGDTIEERFIKEFNRYDAAKIEERLGIASQCGVNIDELDMVTFSGYCFPRLYKYIKKHLGSLPRFHEYQKRLCSSNLQ